jgi:hypothetical protein
VRGLYTLTLLSKAAKRSGRDISHLDGLYAYKVKVALAAKEIDLVGKRCS